MKRRFGILAGCSIWRGCWARQAPRSSQRCRSSGTSPATRPSLAGPTARFSPEKGLKDTGYVEGENVGRLEHRWAEGCQFDRLPEKAAGTICASLCPGRPFASP